MQIRAGSTPMQRDFCPVQDRPTNHNRLSTMSLDKYDEGAIERGIFNTNKDFWCRTVCWFRCRDRFKRQYILTKWRTNDWTWGFVWEADVFFVSRCMSHWAFWWRPLEIENEQRGSRLIAVCNSSGDARLVFWMCTLLCYWSCVYITAVLVLFVVVGVCVCGCEIYTLL